MFGKDMSLIAQMEQSPVVMVATQVYVATPAAIATVRTRIGIVLDMT
jgi:hypothetical protein